MFINSHQAINCKDLIDLFKKTNETKKFQLESILKYK